MRGPGIWRREHHLLMTDSDAAKRGQHAWPGHFVPVRIEDPSALVVAIPYLVGFHPGPSAVIVVVDREGLVELSLRVDVPEPQEDSESIHAWAMDVTAMLLRAISRLGDSQTCTFRTLGVVFAVGDSPDAAHEVRCAAAIVESMEVAGSTAPNLVVATESSWIGISNGVAEEPVPLDPQIAAAVRFEFTLRGRGVLGSRLDVERLVRDEAVSVDPLPQLASAGRQSRADAVVAGARSIQILRQCLRRSPVGVTASERVELRSLIADLRVRDAVLLGVLGGPTADGGSPLGPAESLPAVDVIPVLCEVLRTSPAGHGAPIASLVAGLAYGYGHGTLASEAAAVGLEHDPTQGLCLLVRQAIASAMHPAPWADLVRSLSLETMFGDEESRAVI